MKNVTRNASAPKFLLEALTSKSSPKTSSKKSLPTEERKKSERANLAKAAKDLHEEKIRDNKYIYPDDCTTAKEKKDFRRKTREHYKHLEAKIKRLTKSNNPSDVKELKGLAKEMKLFISTNYNPSKIED